MNAPINMPPPAPDASPLRARYRASPAGGYKPIKLATRPVGSPLRVTNSPYRMGGPANVLPGPNVSLQSLMNGGSACYNGASSYRAYLGSSPRRRSRKGSKQLRKVYKGKNGGRYHLMRCSKKKNYKSPSPAFLAAMAKRRVRSPFV